MAEPNSGAPDDATIEAIQRWSGVTLPGPLARHALQDLEGMIAAIAAQRGTLVFEDEPSSFEATLAALKDRG